jgi:hypothetical protein
LGAIMKLIQILGKSKFHIWNEMLSIRVYQVLM